MVVCIAYLSNPEHSKKSFKNLEYPHMITIYKTILAKRTTLLTFSQKLKMATGGGKVSLTQ